MKNKEGRCAPPKGDKMKFDDEDEENDDFKDDEEDE